MKNSSLCTYMNIYAHTYTDLKLWQYLSSYETRIGIGGVLSDCMLDCQDYYK